MRHPVRLRQPRASRLSIRISARAALGGRRIESGARGGIDAAGACRDRALTIGPRRWVTTVLCGAADRSLVRSGASIARRRASGLGRDQDRRKTGDEGKASCSSQAACRSARRRGGTRRDRLAGVAVSPKVVVSSPVDDDALGLLKLSSARETAGSQSLRKPTHAAPGVLPPRNTRTNLSRWGASELGWDDACALHGCPSYGRCFCVARD